MRINILVPVLAMGWLFTSCSAPTNGTDQPQGSALTAINVNLPSKRELPKSLQGEGLQYCFGITETGVSAPAYQIGEPSCAVPYATGETMKKGPYESAVTLDGKLDSSKSYQLSLVVGYAAQDVGSTSKRGIPLQETGIDLNRVFYHGLKFVSPEEMQGKSSLKVTIELNHFGTDTGEDPDTISTSSDLDLEVDAVFQERDPNGPV